MRMKALLNNKAQSLNLILELRTSHRSPPSRHWCMCLRGTTFVDDTLFIKSVDNSMVCIRAEMSTVFLYFSDYFKLVLQLWKIMHVSSDLFSKGNATQALLLFEKLYNNYTTAFYTLKLIPHWFKDCSIALIK